jgi:hypothetical protein
MNCTMNGKCRCGDNEYHDLSSLTCLAQKSFGESCDVTLNCRIDKYLECQSGTCKCMSSYPTWSAGYDKCIVPVSYSELCYVSTDCDTSKSLVCNNGTNSCNCPNLSTSGKCDCSRENNNEYFWSGTSCTLAFTYNKTCSNSSTDYMCKTLTEGLKCSGGSQSKCKCSNLQYYKISSSKCFHQLFENASCPQGDECRNDLGLSCQSSKCLCNSLTQFWNSSVCVNKYTYNADVCTDSTQCKSNLICRNSGTSCKCPDTVSNKCDCPTPVIGSEYYWNGTDCTIASSYGGSCSGNYACKSLQEKTICSSSTCNCDTTISIWKSTVCLFCNNGWQFISDKCYRVGGSVSGITFGVANSSSVISACYSQNGAQLATVDTSAISTYFYANVVYNNYYYVDGFKVGASSVWKSSDGTWTVPSSSCNGWTSNQCMTLMHDRSWTFLGFTYNKCFQDNLCSATRAILCEYSL